MGRIEGVDGVQCGGRALVFEGRHAGVEGGIGHTVGTDHSGEERVIVEAGRGLGIDVVLKRSVRCSAGSSLVGNGTRIRGDARRVGRNVRVVAIDLALQATVGAGTSRGFIGDGTGVRRNTGSVRGDVRSISGDAGSVGRDARSVGRDVRVIAVDLALQTTVGRGTGGSLIGDGTGVGGNARGIRGDVRVVAIDLALQTAVRRGASRSFIGDGTGVRGDGSSIGGARRSIGGDVRVVAVDLALQSAVGRGARRSFVGDGASVRGDGSGIGGARRSIGGDVRVVAVNLALQSAVGGSAVGGFLVRHHSQAVGFGLGSTRGVQGDRDGSHGHGPEGFESITTVDLHLEGEATSGPFDRSETFRTLDAADGEVDQAEAVGHDPIVGLRPDGSIRCVGQGKANVQGRIFQCITVRIAGDSLVSNPIALLGLSGESRGQQNCGQKE